MKSIVAVLIGTSLAVCGLAPAASASERIVGGSAAAQGQFGFMAWIVYFKRSGTPEFACSGTLVSPNVVLTAGHCTARETNGVAYNARQYRVVTGAANWTDARLRTVTGVSRVIPDPRFDPAKLRHDDGLLVLSSPVNQTPVAMWDSAQVSAGTGAEIAGWGETHANSGPTRRLRWARTVVQSSAYCSRPFFPGFSFDPSSQLCTTDTPTDSTGTCSGDSGGPLLVQESSGELIEVGVTSGGSPTCSTRKPDYFTAVGPIQPWVSSKIRAYARHG